MKTELSWDTEVRRLIDQEREWERRRRELGTLAEQDKRAVLRGMRNGFLLLLPVVAALAWWISR